MASLDSFEIEVFYDGDCPLCLREIEMLRWLDGSRGRVLFTDIADDSFTPEDFGRTMDQLMAEIHGRASDGTWIIGVEVFRRLYTAVGFGILVWPTRLPGISHIADWGYRWFARNRLKMTGRCTDRCKPQETFQHAKNQP